MNARDTEPIMPHIEEELEKIVEKDFKIKNLEDEISPTRCLDSGIQRCKDSF